MGVLLSLIFVAYLITLAWALKEAFYQSQRVRHLVETNRELQKENQHYREKYLIK